VRVVTARRSALLHVLAVDACFELPVLLEVASLADARDVPGDVDEAAVGQEELARIPRWIVMTEETRFVVLAQRVVYLECDLVLLHAVGERLGRLPVGTENDRVAVGARVEVELSSRCVSRERARREGEEREHEEHRECDPRSWHRADWSPEAGYCGRTRPVYSAHTSRTFRGLQ